MARFASAVTLLLVMLTSAMAQDCPSQPNVAAIVIGTIAGTLVVVAVIFAVGAFLWWRHQKKARQDVTKRNGTDTTTEHVYENQTFQGDVERGQTAEPRKHDGGKGFGGYVQCRDVLEFEAARVQGMLGERNGGTRMLFAKSATVPRHRHGYGLQKAGSRGSLDNSLPNLEPEVISVLLESRDPIGLGFDICGSMRDGIYVSQVHNRGPAIETGLVKIGDRVLSMTISFENMVLEDALTIISYASPYPVRVLLQKAVSLEDTESMTNGCMDLQHSLYYRSQSLNDLSQISKDGLMGPRRAFSEMRTLPMERNKKWAQQDSDLPEEEMEMAHQSASDVSVEIHDLKINSTDLMCESDATNGSGKVNPSEVVVKVIGKVGENIEMSDMQRERNDAQDDDSMQKLSVEDKLAVIRLSYENPEDSDIDSVVARTNGTETDKPIDSSNISMDVNVNEDSILMRDEPTIPLETSPREQDVNGQSQKLTLRVEDEGVRAVLRDYFSGQPALMEQFGISEQSGNNSDANDSHPTNIMVERQSLEVEDVKMRSNSSSEVSTPSSSFDIQNNADLKDGAQSESPVLQRQSAGGLSFDVTMMNISQKANKAQEKEVERKGGIAYYVRMEEQHNPIPEIYSFPKMADVSQPSLIDVSQRDTVTSPPLLADCDSASENNNVSDAESIMRKKRVIHPSPVDLSDENGYGDDDDEKSTASRNSSNDAPNKGAPVKAKLSVEDITMIRCDDTQAALIGTVHSEDDETEA